MTRLRWLAALLLASALVAAGCGGDDGGSAAEQDDDGSSEAAEELEEADGQVLVDDDFDDDENGWTPDDLDAPGEQDAGIDDGELRVSFESDGRDLLEEGDTVLVPNQSWPTVLDGAADEIVDVQLEAEASLEVPGSVGLLCRIADPSPDATDFGAYMFQVGSAGAVNIARLDAAGENLDGLAAAPERDEDEELPDELPVDGAVFDIDDADDLELAFRCEDTDDGVELTGYIDGEAVVSAVDDDDPIESGTVGVLMGQSLTATEVAGFEPYEVSYDSFTATNLGDEIDEDLLEGEVPSEPADDPTEPADDPSSGAVGLLGTPAEPTTLSEFGTDTAFDELADRCYGGDFLACDDLYGQTPVGGEYELYGATCGLRLETEVNGSCEQLATFAAQPATPAAQVADFGTDPSFDQYALDCEAGDLEACDDLYLQTPVGSTYEAYGTTCGNRASGEIRGDCIPS